jgi:hypothetical protein
MDLLCDLPHCFQGMRVSSTTYTLPLYDQLRTDPRANQVPSPRYFRHPHWDVGIRGRWSPRVHLGSARRFSRHVLSGGSGPVGETLLALPHQPYSSPPLAVDSPQTGSGANHYPYKPHSPPSEAPLSFPSPDSFVHSM